MTQPEIKYYELNMVDIPYQMISLPAPPEYPDFHKVTWPFIVSKRQWVEEVIIFREKPKSFFQWFQKRRVEPDPPLSRLGKMAALEDKDLESLKDTAFWGDLDAFFVSGDIRLLEELSGLFPKECGNSCSDDCGFTNPQDVENLHAIVCELEQTNKFAISLYAETTALCIFGGDKIMKYLHELRK